MFLILSAGFPLLAAEDRVQVKLDTSEADSVLAILAKRKQAQPLTDADWNTLFATDPYQRLKKREAAMQRSFSDDDFRTFVLADELLQQYDDLARTLAAWKRIDMRAGGLRVLPYLPAQAEIHVKVFPEIKPTHNSFVFDVDTDPAIFLYLDPNVSPQEFDNTVSHEMHHIGLSSTERLYEKKLSTLTPASQKAALWMGAFGEGLALLAAAGGPDVPPNVYSQPDRQANWELGMKNFSGDLATLDVFFWQVLDGHLQGDAVDQKAYTFFGAIQGPWYTVGYRMAVLVEKRFGRPALIECMLDPRQLLARYNQAAEELNASGKDHLPLWSPQVLKGVTN
ncbi:MAG TPA: DUF5700 domain-containing putative Zn-dependent protease [Candidatus Acidoferrum sp.]|nr:DUF5700 domain-containing putative Zn-dependent protease [Candidatus Acidoferrum sp.]